MSEDVQAIKVALIGPVFPFRGGIAHYTTSLAKTLQEQNHQLLLISFKRQYPAWLYPGVTDKDPSERGFEAGEPKFWLDSLNPLTWLTTFGRMRSFAPQVIVLQWWTTFFAPIWLVFLLLNKLLLDAPIVFICHNVLPHEERWLDRWIVWCVLGQSSQIVVQSEVEYARVVALLPKAAVSIVPHPVHDILATDIFAAKRVLPLDARQSLGITDGQFVLLFFGMIRAYKGLRELLYALAVVCDTYPAVRLLIAGEFWEDKREYLALIQRLGLDDFVTIDDRYIPNENVACYYAAADLLVAPYRHHTGSAVIQVAAALQLPLITLNNLPVESRGASLSSESALFKQRVEHLTEAILAHAHVEFNQNGRPSIKKTGCTRDHHPAIESSWGDLAKTVSSAAVRL